MLLELEKELDNPGLNQCYKRTIKEMGRENPELLITPLAGIQLRTSSALKDIPLPLTTRKTDP